jgi:AcrR family transcriptional regulator
MTTIKETDVHVETADPQGVDSWDSVTQQPFCSVCLMAFKSLSALERHEKFSELHEKVLKKLKDDYEQQHAEAVDVQQIEGIHYKLLYTGRKLYWRTQESVDFSFYYHFESKTVEIIAFHIESMDEINRLYLDHVILTKIIEQLFARKTFDSDDLAIIAAQTELEKEESLRLTLTTFILSRLCAVDEAATIYGGSNSITFKLTPSDPTKLYPLLAAHPVNLHPVHVNARRRSSTEEIEHMIMGLAHDTNMVVAATTAAENRSNATTAALSAAEKITSIVTDAASVLVSKGRQNRKLGPRQRWIWAARRVIHNLEVEKVKMRFAARK